MFTSVLTFIKKEVVLVTALLLALLSSYFSPPQLAYIDFKVLLLLFNLMVVVAAFKEFKVLDYVAIYIIKKCSHYTTVSQVLIFITFFSAMFVTNDVALLTFIPLTLIISHKINHNPIKTIVFQTLAANLGSSLTPMGNPQNLYIFSYYNLSALDFFKTLLPLVAIAALLLILLSFFDYKTTLELDLTLPSLGAKRSIVTFTVIFIIVLLSVFHVIDYRLAFLITVLGTLFTNWKLLRSVDYSLLLTFIGFFIFVGNLGHIPAIKSLMEQLLNSQESTYFISLAASQIMSNVPATMLIAPFTPSYEALLLGVNIGGLGTLIASLASVISYKLYVKDYPSSSKHYLFQFTLYNLLGLIILVPIMYFILFI